MVQLGGTIPLPVNNTPNPLAKEAQVRSFANSFKVYGRFFGNFVFLTTMFNRFPWDKSPLNME